MSTMPSATRDRVLDAALVAFGRDGIDVTSLDHLAAEVGITKQAILYHFGSKDRLVRDVVDRAVAELAVVFSAPVRSNARGVDAVEALVRATFSLAARRPEVLGLVRSVTRRGGDAATWLRSGIGVMSDRAQHFLAAEMDAGRLRRHDPRMLVLAVYSAVIGITTEPEVMRALGIEPDLRSLVRARRELLELLHRALTPERAET